MHSISNDIICGRQGRKKHLQQLFTPYQLHWAIAWLGPLELSSMGASAVPCITAYRLTVSSQLSWHRDARGSNSGHRTTYVIVSVTVLIVGVQIETVTTLTVGTVMVGVHIETVITLTVGMITVTVTGGGVGGVIVTGGRVGGVTVTVTVELLELAFFLTGRSLDIEQCIDS